jgi:hypothetical protein
MAGRGFGPALGMLVLLSTAASGRPGEPEARAPIALEMPANAPAACAPVAPIPLVNPAVLGDGTPGSVTTAAIQAALDAGGHIRFDVGAGPVTIDVTSELTVSRAAVLDGGGNVTLSGRGLNRVLMVNGPLAGPGYQFGLQNITIANGATPAASGAGMLLSNGFQIVDLRIVNVTFRNNIAIAAGQDVGGGALVAWGAREVLIAGSVFEGNRGSEGGAVYFVGNQTVTILGSRFSDNTATGTGGISGNGGVGGAIAADGDQQTVTLCGTRILDNHSNAYGAGFFSVGYVTPSPTTFYRTTFQGNVQTSSTEFAGGAYVQGLPLTITESSFLQNEASASAGLWLGWDATGTIENSTFYGNVARVGDCAAVAVVTDQAVTLVNTTIVGNSSPGIAGICVGSPNQLTLRNVVLAFNTVGNINLTVAGSNVIQYPQAGPPAVATSFQWADPLILPPAWNGGPTKTMALTAPSPARDAGTATGAPSIDQRGVLRDGAPDLGAYELSTDVIFADGFEP